MRASHSGDGRRGGGGGCKALVAFKNRQSRQRRPSDEVYYASDHTHCYDTRTVRSGPAGSISNAGSNSEVSERDYQNRKVFIPSQSTA